MKDLIKDIIDEYGGREAGSVSEKQAQFYLKERWDKFCDSTFIQAFEIPYKAKFGSLKIFCTGYYLSLILFWYNVPAALVLSLINSVVFIGHFVAYYNWLDFLFPKRISHNLIGNIEPEQEVKSTVIISGHMDSAREFIWWWRLKQTGVVFTILSGFLIGLFPFYLIIYLLVVVSGPDMLIQGVGWIYWLFAIASPITITMFNIHGNKVVPGAQDNLSGVAIATAVGQYFSENRLRHTRINVASFGSEEIGLRGAEAFARRYAKELKEENATCINLDGIKDAGHLTIVKNEPMTLTAYPRPLVARLESSFMHCGVACKKLPLPFGATDGVSLMRAGIPAVTIVGLSFDKLDPTYHTRLDVPEYLDDKALEDTKKVLLHFIKEWDVSNSD